jgi:hypothetical protein
VRATIGVKRMPTTSTTTSVDEPRTTSVSSAVRMTGRDRNASTIRLSRSSMMPR